MPWPWESTTGTDSPEASGTENANNAEYARGYEAGRTGNFISDLVHDGPGQGVSSDQYNKGHEAGQNDRDKHGK